MNDSTRFSSESHDRSLKEEIISSSSSNLSIQTQKKSINKNFLYITISLFFIIIFTFSLYFSSNSIDIINKIKKISLVSSSSLPSSISSILNDNVVIKQPWQTRSNNYKINEKNMYINKLNKILFPKNLNEFNENDNNEDNYNHILPYISTSNSNKLEEENKLKENDEEEIEEETANDINVDYTNYHRKLQIKKKVYIPPVPCVICRGLQTCTILNGYQVEEVYYPNRLTLLETCKVIDSFGLRISNLIFGPSSTFRDTPQCREIVMQYLCLFYGSENDMYTNYCLYQEDVSDPNPSFHKVAPRPPCRSFCVQVCILSLFSFSS